MSLQDLHANLRPYISDGPGNMPWVRHPLVISAVTPERVGWINEVYLSKLGYLEQYSQNDEWQSYVLTHERPWRLDAFIEIADYPDDAEYWELLSHIWRDSENIHQNKKLWRMFWNSDRPMKHHAMDEEERAVLNGLPDRLTIYRGQDRSRLSGMSWTLDRDRAIWFAKRRINRDGTNYLLTATVKKGNVHAYLNDRNEKEIVAERVKVTEREVVVGNLWEKEAA